MWSISYDSLLFVTLSIFLPYVKHVMSANLNAVGGGYKSSCNVEPSLTKESSDGETLKDRL
ncbi:hypothetical protein CsatB_006824 [Cannabis sativa]